LSVPSEHYEQVRTVGKFRVTYPGVRIFAIPNGEQRSKTTGAKLKAEGVSPGIPDLYVPAWRLWIEMKRIKGGSVSAKQKEWHEYLRSIGDTVIVGYGSDHALEMIAQFCSPAGGGASNTRRQSTISESKP